VVEGYLPRVRGELGKALKLVREYEHKKCLSRRITLGTPGIS
jgi:hypothetical protein